MIYEDTDSENDEPTLPRGRGSLTPAVSLDLPATTLRQAHSAPRLNVEMYDGASDGSHSSRPSSALRGVAKAPSLDWTERRKDSELQDSSIASSSSGANSPPASGPRRRNALFDSEFRIVSQYPRRGSDMGSDTPHLLPQRSLDELSNVSGDESCLDVNGASVFENKQLYLMVARCIAYPFNAKHQLETSPPKLKLNTDRFDQVCQILQVCLDREHDKIRQEVILSHNELKCTRNSRFLECLQWFGDTVMQREEVIELCKRGGLSVKELDAIFKVFATKQLTYSSPGNHLNTVELQLWCSTFRKLVEQGSRSLPGSPSSSPRSPISPTNGGPAPVPEKLYRLFQNILGVRSIQHQILYRTCQVQVCVCALACMYVCMYVGMHVCVCVCWHPCVCVCVCVYMYVGVMHVGVACVLVWWVLVCTFLPS